MPLELQSCLVSLIQWFRGQKEVVTNLQIPPNNAIMQEEGSESLKACLMINPKKALEYKECWGQEMRTHLKMKSKVSKFGALKTVILTDSPLTFLSAAALPPSTHPPTCLPPSSHPTHPPSIHHFHHAIIASFPSLISHNHQIHHSTLDHTPLPSNTTFFSLFTPMNSQRI